MDVCTKVGEGVLFDNAPKERSEIGEAVPASLDGAAGRFGSTIVGKDDSLDGEEDSLDGDVDSAKNPEKKKTDAAGALVTEPEFVGVLLLEMSWLSLLDCGASRGDCEPTSDNNCVGKDDSLDGEEDSLDGEVDSAKNPEKKKIDAAGALVTEPEFVGVLLLEMSWLSLLDCGASRGDCEPTSDNNGESDGTTLRVVEDFIAGGRLPGVRPCDPYGVEARRARPNIE